VTFKKLATGALHEANEKGKRKREGTMLTCHLGLPEGK